jgi:hypothetical protein
MRNFFGMAGLGVLGAVAFIGLLGAFAYWQLELGDLGCSEDVQPAVVSPDGASKAILSIRDCGATTSFVTQIYVLPATDADWDEGDLALVSDHGDVKLRWLSAQRLEVDLGTSRVFRQAESVGGIGVAYVGNPTKP